MDHYNHSKGDSLENYDFTFGYEMQGESHVPGSDPYDDMSITSSITTYPVENGRTYHAYQAGSYHFPNDDLELKRLDFQHEVLKFAMRGRNYFAPWSQDNQPEKVLDIATGTGTWAIEMGDEFPETQLILGTDLSAVQPESIPPSVYFVIDDSSFPWSFSEGPFDYIHTRMTLGCWSDMQTEIIGQAFANLKPGGWLESQEIGDATFEREDGSLLAPDHPLRAWGEELNAAAQQANRPLGIVRDLKRWYQEAGFVDVQEEIIRLPLNGWPKSGRERRLGELWHENMANGLSGFCYALFHREREMTKNEIEVYLIKIRRALADQSEELYMKFHVVWGRKPGQLTKSHAYGIS